MNYLIDLIFFNKNILTKKFSNHIEPNMITIHFIFYLLKINVTITCFIKPHIYQWSNPNHYFKNRVKKTVKYINHGLRMIGALLCFPDYA